jgi:antitoxin CcdA
MRMKHDPIVRRRPTNVTLPEGLVGRARALEVNISQACTAGLTAAVEIAEEERWKADNAEWVAAHRRWVEANDLPLERYRLF